MASSFERLSGLFARRKASVASEAASTTSSTPIIESSLPDINETHFPSPSFIRPKTGRMQARDEILVSPKQGARRARSLPEARVPERSSSLKFGQQYRSHSLNNSKRGTPQSTRSSSIMSDARERETLVSTLRRFMFPAPPRRGAISSETDITQPLMAYTLPPSPVSHRSPRGSPRGSPHGSPRSQTPTSFVDGEPKTAPSTWLNFTLDATRPSFQSRYKAKLPALAPHMAIFTGHPPTPDWSPCITPTMSHSSYGSSIKAAQLDQNQRDGRRGAVSTPPQDRFANGKNPSPMSTRFSSRDSLTLPLELLAAPLTVPDVDDFLALSDDDIAETESPAPIAKPLPHIPSRPGTTDSAISALSSAPSTSSSRITPLYTTPRPLPIPEPIRTHPTATAAAFEAAKIAAKFKFDLVYVLNLWPEPRSPKRHGRIKTTLPTLSPQRGMTGRLLAAYGLSNIDSPLNISAAVHSKILQTAGWIEYRSQDAEPAEFARGYACAFYKGNFDQPAASLGPVHCDQIDRGIVFAAYRKERVDGGEAGSSAAELSELRRSAESLVEMLIDMDTAERRRAPGGAPFSDLTGPMPRRQLPTFF